MSARHNLGFALTRTYRFDGPGDAGSDEQVHLRLQEASDALAIALLTLEGRKDDSRQDKCNRAAKVRSLLAEAVTALSRAKVYVPEIHTYAVPAVMAGIQAPDAEFSRLYQLASTLSLRNHALLPSRGQGRPLSPDEEAQLRRVFEGLKLHAKLGRATRHRWLAFGATLGLLTPMLGLPIGVMALGCVAFAGWQYAKQAQPAQLAG